LNKRKPRKTRHRA